MGYVPSHRDDCRKLKSYGTHCQYCDRHVVYFECSCGSKVFFNPYYEGKSGVHDCGEGVSHLRADHAHLLIFLIDESKKKENQTGSTQCPMCGTSVKNDRDRVRKHFRKCPGRSNWFGYS